MAVQNLKKIVLKTLRDNDQTRWTRPAADIYPHQWLWDSCFIAIGLAHSNPLRAAAELRSLLRAQWQNGLVPHMVFHNGLSAQVDPWRSSSNPLAPEGLPTSGITQPPLLATAVLKVADALPNPQASEFLGETYPSLLRYHEWLYRERNHDKSGLIAIIHPWESGMDNAPPWISIMKQIDKPKWLSLLLRSRLYNLFNSLRNDTRIPSGQRVSTKDAILALYLADRYRRCGFDSQKILQRSVFAIESVIFNSILIKANSDLEQIASRLKQTVPDDLKQHFADSRRGLELLWQKQPGQYHSRQFKSHKTIPEATVATLLPLYSGAISKARARQLVELMKSQFNTPFRLPSVPPTSPDFNAERYWQGPVWLNMNWLVIEGLKQYGYNEEARLLTKQSLAMVEAAGCYEYFSPLTGEGLGAKDFSWTAALALDLLES